jgi:MinD-like ATPase involved in chromosome partitioning or flagellar assembly
MATTISVHSFRGGTGKSNVTANVAVTLARRGRRVGIVDTDIQSPGIHVIFGLDDARVVHSLNDYLWGRCSIEAAACDVSSLATGAGAAGGALYLVPSSIKAGEIARVLREGYDVERLTSGFQDLVSRLRLDYLFIDTHPGLNEETLLSITVSDVLIVILRPDRQDYQGTAVTVEVARKLDVPKLFLVINKALHALDPAALRQQAEQAYQAPVAAILPLSEDVAELASGGLFCLRDPDHAWSRAIERIVDQVEPPR